MLYRDIIVDVPENVTYGRISDPKTGATKGFSVVYALPGQARTKVLGRTVSAKKNGRMHPNEAYYEVMGLPLPDSVKDRQEKKKAAVSKAEKPAAVASSAKKEEKPQKQEKKQAKAQEQEPLLPGSLSTQEPQKPEAAGSEEAAAEEKAEAEQPACAEAGLKAGAEAGSEAEACSRAEASDAAGQQTACTKPSEDSSSLASPFAVNAEDAKSPEEVMAQRCQCSNHQGTLYYDLKIYQDREGHALSDYALLLDAVDDKLLACQTFAESMDKARQAEQVLKYGRKMEVPVKTACFLDCGSNDCKRLSFLQKNGVEVVAALSLQKGTEGAGLVEEARAGGKFFARAFQLANDFFVFTEADSGFCKDEEKVPPTNLFCLVQPYTLNDRKGRVVIVYDADEASQDARDILADFALEKGCQEQLQKSVKAADPLFEEVAEKRRNYFTVKEDAAEECGWSARVEWGRLDYALSMAGWSCIFCSDQNMKSGYAVERCKQLKFLRRYAFETSRSHDDASTFFRMALFLH